MYLSKFQILNYKSFRDSKSLEFKPGINIIVGSNDSGKTALLEALSLNFKNQIHKSLKTFPLPSSDVVNSYSGYQLSLSVKKESIRLFIDKLPKSYNSPIIIIPDRFKINDSYYDHEAFQALKNFLNDKDSNKDVEIQIRARASGEEIPFDSIPDFFSSFYNTPVESFLKEKELNLTELAESLNPYRGFFNFDFNRELELKSVSLAETVQYQIFQKYRNIIYKFDAERVNSGTSPAGTSRILKSDASNLAEVLSILQSNRTRFDKFNKYVSTVIPSIKWINVSQLEGINVEIKVWKLDPAEDREDLAYSLSDSGTGVSQVLAILYVVITSQEPKIIIIDELQTFLHPGAAKKLIEILKIFSQHQYFITTHSADIIATANPSTIVNLQYKEGETHASTMNMGDIREQRSLLAQLGVNLSDVFGADRILWVEGPTEEICFPIILSKLAPEFLIGTKIISVKNTGDLLGKKTHFAEVMFDLYRRLSGGNNLYPPVLGFVFDRENRDKQDMEDLQKRSSERVYFLKRCMYENYLLHPKAIAAVLNQYDWEQKHHLTSEIISKELESNKVKLKGKKEYFSKETTPDQLLNTQYVDENINAAKLLHVLFANLSSNMVKFEKTTHSFMLTEWLLENDPNHLVELVQFLQNIFAEDKGTLS